MLWKNSKKNCGKFAGKAGREARQFLKRKIPSLVNGAREAIKRHSSSVLTGSHSEKIPALVQELINGPSHVFGKHAECTDFCQRKMEPELLIYKSVFDSGMLAEVTEIVRHNLVSCAHSLIYNASNNPAECYMSHLCKTLGGKRVDYAKDDSIRRRANIAALAYQMPRQKWQYKASKVLTGRSPHTPQRKFLERRERQYLDGLKRKKNV